MIKLVHDDCIKAMQQLKEGSVDLTVTSPPYDNLRTYNDSLEWGEHVWKPCLEQLYRITKKGGVVVWVVGDATINGSETGTSFKQVLYAKDCGFNLHDTMIYEKNQLAFPDVNRYYQSFEYMFVLSKGSPKAFNPIKDRVNKTSGRKVDASPNRNPDGSKQTNKSGAGSVRKCLGVRWNRWLIYNQSRGKTGGHPAVFPYKLAHDHIISWSNEGDTVLDPFMGSGTTGIACKDLARSFIGIEKVEKYFQFASDRIHSHNVIAKQWLS